MKEKQLFNTNSPAFWITDVVNNSTQLLFADVFDLSEN